MARYEYYDRCNVSTAHQLCRQCKNDARVTLLRVQTTDNVHNMNICHHLYGLLIADIGGTRVDGAVLKKKVKFGRGKSGYTGKRSTFLLNAFGSPGTEF